MEASRGKEREGPLGADTAHRQTYTHTNTQNFPPPPNPPNTHLYTDTYEQIKFQVISPRSSHVTIMFVVDPHMRSSLAMNAINYCIKHSAGA